MCNNMHSIHVEKVCVKWGLGKNLKKNVHLGIICPSEEGRMSESPLHPFQQREIASYREILSLI